jgi:hypothetical protein
MQKILSAKWSGKVLLASMIVGLVLFIWSLVFMMIPAQKVLLTKTYNLVCLQLAFTPQRAGIILTDWGPEGIRDAKALHLPGDFIFPVGYMLLFVGFLGLLIRRQSGIWFKLGCVVLWFPVVAMLCDYAENIILLQMLQLVEQKSLAAIPLWMPVFASIKYLLLSVLISIYGLAAVISAMIAGRINRGWRDISFYLMVGVILLTNVLWICAALWPCI